MCELICLQGLEGNLHMQISILPAVSRTDTTTPGETLRRRVDGEALNVEYTEGIVSCAVANTTEG